MVRRARASDRSAGMRPGRIRTCREEHDAEEDCYADPTAPAGLARSADGADRSGEDRHAISGDEVSP